MRVRFIQTSDVSYRALLEATSKSVMEYCSRKGFEYQTFFGIVRGYYPWHASFNRIPIIKQILDGGFRGWLCYVDADAYVADLDFDLEQYLENYRSFSFIAAPGGPEVPWYNVNAGVFLLNLDHPVGREIAIGWAKRFDEITEEQLKSFVLWERSIEDQMLLSQTLRAIENCEKTVLVDKGRRHVLNYEGGLFIRQMLRVTGSYQQRVLKVQREVENILAAQGRVDAARAEAAGQTGEAFVTALYRNLLFREPDAGGLRSSQAHLSNGASYDAVLRTILKSKEFRTKRENFYKLYFD